MVNDGFATEVFTDFKNADINRNGRKRIGDEGNVEIDFDGKILSFKIDQQEIVMTAEGSPWQSRFHFPVSDLKNLPKHIMDSEVTLSIWDDRFHIGNWSYRGIVEKKNSECHESN